MAHTFLPGAERRTRLEGFLDRGGMVREVVVHGDAARLADDFEPPLDTCKRGQSSAQRLEIKAQVDANGDGDEGVPHVVVAQERHRELAKIVILAVHAESGATAKANVEPAPFGVDAKTEGLHTAASVPGKS